MSKEMIKHTKKHYHSLDGIRTFAAIGIVMMHMASKDNNNYEIAGTIFNRIIPFFTNFVFLFMMVSAFGICCGYYEKISKGMITPAEFYAKRYQKILPYFALLVCLDLVMDPGIASLIEAFADVTLVFGLLPNANISVIGVGWFLGTVFVFYLLFPFFCFLMKTKKRAWIAFATAILYHLACIVYFTQAGRTNFIYCAMFFMAGCMIYLYRDNLTKIVAKYRWVFLGVIAVITIGFFMVKKNEMLSNLWMLCMFSSFLIYAISVESKLLSNPVTKFIASISMEIYLGHMVIFRILEKLHLNYLFGTGWLSYLVTVVMVGVGTVIFSICVKKVLKCFMHRYMM